MSHNPLSFIKRASLLFLFFGGGLILHLLYPTPAYSKPLVSTEKYQARRFGRKSPQYCKAKDGSLIRIGGVALEKISLENGGGKSLEFVLPEDDCSPEDLKKVHSIPGIKTICLHSYSGNAELNALQGYRDLQNLSVGNRVTAQALSVLKTFPNLKRIVFWEEPKLLKGIGLKYLAECSSLEKLDVPRFSPGSDYTPLLKMKKLKDISIAFNKDSISTIANLRFLEKLRLQVNSDDATSEELALMLSQLKSLKQLKHLSIRIGSRTNPSVVSAEVVKKISEMESLEVLYLPEVQSQDFWEIGRLKSLRRLSIKSTYSQMKKPIDYDISQLKDLKKLEELDINGRFPQSGLKVLKQFPNLKFLRLNYSKEHEKKGAFVVTDEDLRLYVSTLHNLEYLSLIGQPEVTDQGIMSLTHLTKLDDWSFKSTDKISIKGIQAFREKLAQMKMLKQK